MSTATAPEATEVVPANEGVRGRGRPRPPEVIERDESVFEGLTEPMTIRQLAEKLDVPRNFVYLSLWRLRDDKRVRRRADEHGGNTHVWERT